jgi:hypothetical protein
MVHLYYKLPKFNIIYTFMQQKPYEIHTCYQIIKGDNTFQYAKTWQIGLDL